MTLKAPLYMQPTGGDPTIQYSGLDMRGLIDGLFAAEGVISGLRVSQRGAGANFSVDISAGSAVVIGDDVSNQGKYLAQSTAVENRTIPNPPGSGSRTHRVVVQIRDKLHNGAWSTYEATIDVLADTGSGTPSTPPSAFSLATVTVAAAQASVLDTNITNNAPAAALVPRPVWSSQSADMAGSATGNFVTTGTWTDIPSAKWPALSFTVPKSGSVFVSVTANILNQNTPNSTIWCGYRGSGGGFVSGTASATMDPRGLSAFASARTYATKRRAFSGLTPDATVTLTPVYYVTSVGPTTDTYIMDGQLMAEPVA